MVRNARVCPVRRGVTLIELLVVISIMMLLTAVAIPMVRPMLERRPVREAARAVSAYLEGAQIRARETGRPCGVWIERFANQSQAAFTLHQAEVPPPYAGSSTTSTARLNGSFSGTFTMSFSVTSDLDTIDNYVHQGDQLQLNYQGPWYRVESATSSGVVVRLDTSSGATVPWLGSGKNSPYLPFQFTRQPVRTATKPLQLPGTTVIDLYFSGTSNHLFEPNGPSDQRDVIIMFTPGGGVDSVAYFNRDGNAYVSSLVQLTEPVHLLIGRRERLSQTVPATGGDPRPSLAEDERLNIEDLNNLWVTAFPRTGLITVSENANLPSGFNYNSRLADCVTARTFAAQGQSIGGR